MAFLAAPTIDWASPTIKPQSQAELIAAEVPPSPLVVTQTVIGGLAPTLITGGGTRAAGFAA